jgi:hypothetical protein
LSLSISNFLTSFVIQQKSIVPEYILVFLLIRSNWCRIDGYLFG